MGKRRVRRCVDAETASATKLSLRPGAAGTNAAPPRPWLPIILVLTHDSLPTPVTPSTMIPPKRYYGGHGGSTRTQRVPCVRIGLVVPVHSLPSLTAADVSEQLVF